MVYQFIRVLEFSFTDVIFEVVANSLHDANKAYILAGHDLNDYDILSINGEWI